MLEFIDVVAASALGICAYHTLFWLGGCIVSATKRSVVQDVKWRRRTDAPIYDLAGNEMQLGHAETCVYRDVDWCECGFTKPMPNHVADPVPPSAYCDPARPCRLHDPCPLHDDAVTEIAVNKLTPVGFFAATLRLSQASHERTSDVLGHVEVWADSLCKELKPCATCSRVGGLHNVDCVEVRDNLDMAATEMLGEEKEIVDG